MEAKRLEEKESGKKRDAYKEKVGIVEMCGTVKLKDCKVRMDKCMYVCMYVLQQENMN